MGSGTGDGDPEVMDCEPDVLFADDFGQYPVEEWHEDRENECEMFPSIRYDKWVSV